MARPIKETPILYGEDARRFEARMQEKRSISQEERERINAHYRAGMAMLERGMKRRNAPTIGLQQHLFYHCAT